VCFFGMCKFKFDFVVHRVVVEGVGNLISVLAGAGSLGFMPLIRRPRGGPEGTFFGLTDF